MALSLRRSVEQCNDEHRVTELKRYVSNGMLQGVKMKLESGGSFSCGTLLLL
jgi:hypothetical protein